MSNPFNHKITADEDTIVISGESQSHIQKITMDFKSKKLTLENKELKVCIDSEEEYITLDNDISSIKIEKNKITFKTTTFEIDCDSFNIKSKETEIKADKKVDIKSPKVNTG
ncbi:hypothetical protein IB642_01275 [Allofrancisella guangzhouensis]|uniref:Uncharacterized protein n=1 Tax=Allofrancisella guangzhouensis TaxID=594679 RepID=A0A0A8E634_9GAMM|nr:hypothetical protein [Allofrancisella guangzhouensis]AJC49434.1 hypothetical protein SD28_07290 [Allofrancisella guangzhouensis]MBK2026725.1 hypothetical protein [Allofrancisella guangzhouensis]MBK2043650.1 hypothetical protein [Allofrancisella guangzhouensis]MBK2046195.1 hypothetical protein [Allofrancisella guangzhouensis]